jgi:CRP-like cAMP-binding protein
MSSELNNHSEPLAVKTINIGPLCRLTIAESYIPFRPAQTKSFPSGSFVYSEGTVPDLVLTLREGSADLMVKDQSGELRRIRSVEPNEVFGFTESLTETPFDTTLKAISDCQFEYINASEFKSLLRDDGELRFKMLERMATGLQRYLNSFRNQFDEL